MEIYVPIDSLSSNSSQYSDYTLTTNESFDIDHEVLKGVEVSRTCDQGDFCFMRYSTVWTIALCVAYLFVFFIGLVGNLSVLWIIWKFRRTHDLSMFNSCNKVFNGLIGNLAFADLLVVLFCLPPTLIGNIFSRKQSKFSSIIIENKSLNKSE